MMDPKGQTMELFMVERISNGYLVEVPGGVKIYCGDHVALLATVEMLTHDYVKEFELVGVER